MQIKWKCFYHKVIKPLLYGIGFTIVGVIVLGILLIIAGSVYQYLNPVPPVPSMSNSYSYSGGSGMNILVLSWIFIIGMIGVVISFFIWLREKSKPCIISRDDKGVMDNLFSAASAILNIICVLFAIVFGLIGGYIGIIDLMITIMVIMKSQYDIVTFGIIGFIGLASIGFLYFAWMLIPSHHKELLEFLCDTEEDKKGDIDVGKTKE